MHALLAFPKHTKKVSKWKKLADKDKWKKLLKSKKKKELRKK